MCFSRRAASEIHTATSEHHPSSNLMARLSRVESSPWNGAIALPTSAAGNQHNVPAEQLIMAHFLGSALVVPLPSHLFPLTFTILCMRLGQGSGNNKQRAEGPNQQFMHDFWDPFPYAWLGPRALAMQLAWPYVPSIARCPATPVGSRVSSLMASGGISCPAGPKHPSTLGCSLHGPNAQAEIRTRNLRLRRATP